MLKNLSLKWKVAMIAVVVFIPAMAIGTYYLLYQVYWISVRTALSGHMNFVDAKQQGVIRFIGQNEKLAVQLAALAKSAPPEVLREHLRTVVATDVFDPKGHPFRAEIESGKRRIATWHVYHAIDLVRDGVIAVSSDPGREGKPWMGAIDLKTGYSDVYLDNKLPVISFAAASGNAMLYVQADARVLTLITNGEIGNVEGDMGTYYLAGVGETLDYYIVNRDNVMITESRRNPESMLKASGSLFPWMATQMAANIACSSDGTYKTNAGLVTGCREAMGFYENKQGTRMLGVSMPFYDSAWTIVVEQEASDALLPLIRQLGIMTIIGVLIALVTLMVFIFAIDRMVFRRLRGMAG